MHLVLIQSGNRRPFDSGMFHMVKRVIYHGPVLHGLFEGFPRQCVHIDHRPGGQPCIKKLLPLRPEHGRRELRQDDMANLRPGNVLSQRQLVRRVGLGRYITLDFLHPRHTLFAQGEILHGERCLFHGFHISLLLR